MIDFPESDWKIFRTVRAEALDRYCARVLAECAAVIHEGEGSNHDRYGRLYGLIEKRDKTLADAFDDFRRSTAFYQLAKINRLGLITQEELARFSPNTREVVVALTTGNFG